MIVNPSGTLLFVDDPSAQGVYVYSIGSGGALSVISGSPFPVGFAPGNLTTDGLGRYLYVATAATGSEIAAFSIGSAGALTAITGSPFSYPMVQVQGDATGAYLIGTAGGASADQHLYLFGITPSGASNAGAITQLEAVPTAYVPYSIAVQPNSSGNLVYSFSINSSTPGFNPIRRLPNIERHTHPAFQFALQQCLERRLGSVRSVGPIPLSFQRRCGAKRDGHYSRSFECRFRRRSLPSPSPPRPSRP